MDTDEYDEPGESVAEVGLSGVTVKASGVGTQFAAVTRGGGGCAREGGGVGFAAEVGCAALATAILMLV